MTNQNPYEQLRARGLKLPSPPKPVASYIPVRLSTGAAIVSGQLPTIEGVLTQTGSVPSAVTPEDAGDAARLCTLNALSALEQAIGSLERVSGVIRVGVFVASDPGFGGQPAIANGASDLLFEVFGERGRHARAAVGVSALPLGAPVEIEFHFEITSESD